MDSKESIPVSPDQWLAMVDEIKRAMGRLASCTLKIHYEVQRCKESVNEGNQRLELALRDLSKDVAALSRDVDHTEEAVDKLRDDLTPVKPFPHATKDEISAETQLRVAKSWVGFLWKHRVEVGLALSLAASLAVHVWKLAHGH